MWLPTSGFRQQTRRTWLKGAAAGVAAVLTGCGRRESTAPATTTAATTGATSAATLPGDFAGQTCRIFVYAGFCEQVVREFVVPRVESELGAQCVLDAGWWDSISRLRAAPARSPPFELVITDATQGLPAIRDGLFRTLDWSRIPNRGHFTPAALDNSVVRDGYGLTYPDSVMSLAASRPGCPFNPRQWADLLDPKVSGRVGLYDSFYMSLYTFACLRHAVEKTEKTPHELIAENWGSVVEFARKHREIVGYWWATSNDMLAALRQKTCWLGNMHSPELFAAASETDEFAWTVPTDHRAFVQILWLVPAGTPRFELAERVLNIIASPEAQRGFAERGSACAIPEVAAEMAARNSTWASMYPHTPEQFASVRYYPYEVYSAHWHDITDAWTRRVLRGE
jgi:spermidine/putrescine-binding protein